MSLRWSVVFAVVGLAASAGPNPADSVAKIRSYPCANPSITRAGSAVFVRAHKRILALTSSHVIYHGGEAEKICHEILSQNGYQKAKLVGANFLKGLALFEIPQEQDFSSVAVEIPSSLPVSPPAAVVAGYALESKSPVTGAAHIVNLKGERNILPLVPQVIEVDSHIELGMSGGALVSKDGPLLGIISHYYLPNEKGQKAPRPTVYSASSKTGEEVTGLIIPVDVISPWIKATLDGDKGSFLVEALSSQTSGERVSAELGGIQWTQLAAAVAGIDGGGVGGEDRRGLPKGERIGIELTISKTSRQPWPFSERPWLARLKRQLEARSTVTVTGVVLNGERHEVSDLLGFFSLINRGGRPLYRVSQSEIKNLSSVEAQLLTQVSKAERALAPLKKHVRPRGAGAALVSQISTLLDDLSSRNYEEIEHDAIKKLINPPRGDSNDAGWDELSNLANQFEAVVELRRVLLDIVDLLAQMRV